MRRLSNVQLARHLRQAADLLTLQSANPFRINAYRRAAETLERLPEPLAQLFEREGFDGLVALPGVGRGIGGALIEMLRTGHWRMLERLRGSEDPETLFQKVPGVGPALAHRFHEELGLETLDELAQAAHDGRLAALPGLGPRRATALRATLEGLGRQRPRRVEQEGPQPSVAELLDVDAEYRRRAERGELPRIRPRRFNPDGSVRLPVLHTERGGWHFTALFSNTARAHELGRTRDWVVIYWYDDHHDEGQHTVVSEVRGPLVDQRVIRGRESECVEHYTRLEATP